tara:strand:+ start:418 stop:693 length:276 start_codon:yes stop_codon:yes gene_type:complete
MYRRLLQLLMFVILAQSTLAAADAHVLHEVSGEASHQHLVGDGDADAHALRHWVSRAPATSQAVIITAVMATILNTLMNLWLCPALPSSLS